jgi:hypothetical protein
MNAIQKSAIAVLVAAFTVAAMSPAAAANNGGGDQLKINSVNQVDRRAARLQSGAGNAEVMTWQDLLIGSPLHAIKLAGAVRFGANKLDNLDKSDLLAIVSAPWLNWLKGKADQLSGTNG